MLVSSHVLSEVAQTADEPIVIRQGKLVSQTTLAEFTAGTLHRMRVRAADLDRLAAALTENGAAIERDGDGALLVAGAGGEAIGDAALRLGIALHELAPQRSSLEERFLEVIGEEDAPAQPGGGAP